MGKVLNVGDKIGTFEVVSVSNCDDVSGILYEFKNAVCGASLMFLSTSEENKLFSVTFKTIPTDDTGVFHILEHSVLGGSEKYPVREPFVELLKSSMNTFLNAMTFPDKTMYPVSSRNEKDFYNLTSVYLDAVFKPAIYTNPNIFYQEGWHYEVDPDTKEVSVNGVVYNEMKGAESSVDERLINVINEILYPDNCYHHNSGGATESIPTLTYENFINTHKKFYSPDNACFYLEGDLDIAATIALIDEYIYHEESFDPEITVIKDQGIVPATTRVIEYPVTEGEDTSKKTHFIFAKRWCGCDERFRAIAVKVINSYLCGSNSSPLMKKILERNLATEATVSVQTSLKQFYASIEFYNAAPDSEESIREAMREVKAEILKNGFDREDLEAIICRLEFQSLEEREPKAIGHAISAVSEYLYGGNPSRALDRKTTLKELRDGLDNGAYLKIFEELFDEENLCLVVANPSTTLAETEEEQERDRIKKLTSSWKDEDYIKAAEIDENLKKWQQTPDTPELLATLPQLKLADISSKPPKYISNELDIDGVKVLLHPANLSEVTYVRFYFTIPKKYQNRISEINLVTNLLTELPTASYDTVALNREIKKNFGAFNTLLTTHTYNSNPDEAYAQFVLSVSVMKNNIGVLSKFIKEVLLSSDFSDRNIIKSVIDQSVESFREDLISEGHSIGRQRARSFLSVQSAISEQIDGYEYYKVMKNLRENFEDEADSLISFMEEFMRDVITTDGLVVGITMNEKDCASAEVSSEYKLSEILNAIPDGSPDPMNFRSEKYRFDFRFPYVEKTFIKIPGKVSFASLVGSCPKLGMETDGRWSVVANILKYDYLWNRVRVQGGAYGVSLAATRDNNFAFSSYRDPSGEKTFGVYRDSSTALRAYADNKMELEKFIISTIGDSDPLLSPRAYGAHCDLDYFEGYTDEMREESLRLKLGLSYKDLYEIADNLDAVLEADGATASCLVGSDSGSYEPDVVLEI